MILSNIYKDRIIYTMKTILKPKPSYDIIPLTFDFTNVPTTITAVNAIVVTVTSGTDPAPNSIKIGSPVLSGQLVKQLVKGLNGVTYHLDCQAIAGSEQYSVCAILPVEDC